MNARCTNIIGSYNCTCKKGYGGDGRDCSGKFQSIEGIILTDADSFLLHTFRVMFSHLPTLSRRHLFLFESEVLELVLLCLFGSRH